MRFHVDAGAHVVAARDGFPSTQDGEVWVIRGDHPIANRDDPYQRVCLPRSASAGRRAGRSFDNGNGMRIMLQSHGLKWAAATQRSADRAGAHVRQVTNELTGGLYFAFSKYGIEIEQQLELEAGVDPARNAPPSPVDPAPSSRPRITTSRTSTTSATTRSTGATSPAIPAAPACSPPFDYVPASEAGVPEAPDRPGRADRRADARAGPAMIQEAEDQDICVVDGDGADYAARHEQRRWQAGHAAGAGVGHRRRRWPDLRRRLRPRWSR